MRENCRSFACYLDNIRRNRENVDSRSQDGGNDEGNFGRNQNMRVILPVIIVIAIFIILAIAFIIYRFAADYIRKRWMVWRQDGQTEAQNGETRRRERNGQNVSAISAQFRDRPPSYRQVLASIQRDEPPPAYDSVVTGVVNDGYVAVDDSPRRSEDFGRTYEDIVVSTHDISTPPRTQLPHAVHTHSNTQSPHVRPQRHGRRSNQQNQQRRSNNRTTVNRPSRRVDMPPSPLILRSATLETDHHHHLSLNHQAGSPQEQSNISSNTSDGDTLRQSAELSRSKSDIPPQPRESNRNIRRSSTSVNSKDVNTPVIQNDIVMVV